MNLKVLKANALLLTAAVVWGSTFVAQRVGMDNLGPLSYTAIRFTMGAFFLLPLAWRRRGGIPVNRTEPPSAGMVVKASILAGLAMFAGINLQQIGLVHTTAGNAGFITGLYVVIVPLMGLIWGAKPGAGVWIGVAMGASGMYLLSVTEDFSLTQGDGWVLACAFAWAVHVWIVSWLSPKMDTCVLACGQATVCGGLSWLAALIMGETITVQAASAAWLPLLWGGIMSVGVGFTLQVAGQKDSPAFHAAIILSMEAVVAAISGWLILDETMTVRAAIGAGLMLTGMLIAQLWDFIKSPVAGRENLQGVETDAPIIDY